MTGSKLMILVAAVAAAGCAKKDAASSDGCAAVGAKILELLNEEVKEKPSENGEWSLAHQPEIRAAFTEACRKDDWPEAGRRCLTELSFPRDLDKVEACLDALPADDRAGLEAASEALRGRMKADLVK